MFLTEQPITLSRCELTKTKQKQKTKKGNIYLEYIMWKNYSSFIIFIISYNHHLEKYTGIGCTMDSVDKWETVL